MSQINFKGRYFSKNEDAVHISDDKTQAMVDAVIEDLIASKEDVDFVFQATGDTLVAGVKWDEEGEIDIMVTQKYSEACLLKDKYGNYQPIDWMEEEENIYEDMSKKELIDRIRYLEKQRAEYNPRREI